MGNATLNLKINGLASISCSGDPEFVQIERKQFNDLVKGICSIESPSVAPEHKPLLVPQPTCKLSINVSSMYHLSTFLQSLQSGKLHLSMGDVIEIPLADGTTEEFVMTQEDDEAYRFESVDCIFGKCITRDKADESFERYYDLLPKELREEMILTKRRYRNRDGEEREQESLLFLPSAPEVFDPENAYGDNGLYEQMEWYKDHRHIMRKLCKLSKDTVNWWLSSAYAGDTSNFCIVGYTGYANNAIASNTWVGLPVCFRIRKSK